MRAPFPELPNRAHKRAAGRLERKHVRRRQESYVRQLQRHHDKHEAWLRRHRERMAERRGPEPTPPPAIPLETWRACQDVMHDPSGRAARIHLSRLPPVWAGAIRREALGVVEGTCARGWASERARALVCVGLVLCHCARRARRKGKFVFIVRGITRGALAAACKAPVGTWRAVDREGKPTHKPHVNTISGVHRRGARSAHSSQLGYLQALHRSGLLYRQQLPATDPSVEPWEVWPGRDGAKRTANRYWIVNPIPYDGHLTADVRAALLELAASALSLEAIRLRPRARPSSSATPPPSEAPAAPD